MKNDMVKFDPLFTEHLYILKRYYDLLQVFLVDPFSLYCIEKVIF